MKEVPIPTETKLDLKLELFNSINEDYERTKNKCQYLGRWLMDLSGEIMLLRTDLRIETSETIDGQLKLPGTEGR